MARKHQVCMLCAGLSQGVLGMSKMYISLFNKKIKLHKTSSVAIQALLVEGTF